jgi:uncharacterized protein (TIGR03000 family)
MWTNRFLIASVAGCAGLLLMPGLAPAQEHDYGYYYPDTQEWVSYYERPIVQFNVTPENFAAFTHQYPSYAATPMRSYYQPAAASDVANIEVVLPDAQARVWFDGNSTTSTGKDRLFHSPALASGSTYTYRLKASWMRDGRTVTQERTISVTPGQTTVVDLARD